MLEAMMRTFNIALIPGDGIGPEVVAEGVKVLRAIEEMEQNLSFSLSTFPWGCEDYLEHGKMMTDDGIEQLKSFDAINLGAVGAQRRPEHTSLWDMWLRIGKSSDK